MTKSVRQFGRLVYGAGAGARCSLVQRRQRKPRLHPARRREPRSGQACRRQGGLQHRPRTRARRSGIARPGAVPRGQPVAGPPGFRDTMLDYFNRVWRLGLRSASRLRARPWTRAATSSRPSSTSRSPRCACFIIRRSRARCPMASLARASIPTTATSPCSRPMRSEA